MEEFCIAVAAHAVDDNDLFVSFFDLIFVNRTLPYKMHSLFLRCGELPRIK